MGMRGFLVVNPTASMRTSYCQRRAEESEARQAFASFSGPALTATGELVRVMINVTGLAELGDLDPAKVDRDRPDADRVSVSGARKAPDREEQYQIYRRMLEWAAGRPVTHPYARRRSDKPIVGLTQPGDINPFLGVRGVRLSLRHLDVFRAQLRALARAAVAGNLKVMIPMITVPEELDRCRALLEQAVDDCVAKARKRKCRRSHDGRGAGGSPYHRGLQRRLLFHRQQRSDSVRGGSEPRRTATHRSRASFARVFV